MIKTLGQALLTAAIVVVAMFALSLVGDNQSDFLGASGSRFPNGISADSTSPSAGQVRGTTLTVTGAATLSSTLAVSGATTLSSTLTYLEKTAAVTASTTVAQSGTTFYLSGAAATSTLPAVATATGTVFTFVVSASVTGDITVVSNEGDNIEGAVDVNSTIVTVDAADRVLFAQSAENIGDTITIRSDGQKWFVVGTALNAGGLASDG
jgi:hypothetical protein